MVIYSAETQEYDIIEYTEEEVDSDGDLVYGYGAVNEDGEKCGLRLRKKKDSGEMFLHVDFINVIFLSFGTINNHSLFF